MTAMQSHLDEGVTGEAHRAVETVCAGATSRGQHVDSRPVGDCRRCQRGLLLLLDRWVRACRLDPCWRELLHYRTVHSAVIMSEVLTAPFSQGHHRNTMQLMCAFIS